VGQDKKNAQRRRAEIVFADEFGYRYGEGTMHTWAPRGETPRLKHVTAYRRVVSTLVMLTRSGKIYKRHFESSVRSEDVVRSLEHLRRHVPGPIILVWDNASIHRSRKVKEYLQSHPDIQVEYLPPYAPELNPEEYCHGNVKQRIRNGKYRESKQIRKALDAGFARLRKRPDLLQGFFRHAGLESVK